MSDDFRLTPAAAEAIRATQYFTLASSTVYLYDLFLTLGLEVDLLWSSKWTLMKVLYLIQRYLPLIDMVIVMMIWQFGEITDLRTCSKLLVGSSWSYLVGLTLSEVILTRRTLAVWGNTMKIRIGLFLFALVCMVPLYLLLAEYHLTEAFTYHSIPVPGFYCFLTGQSGMSYLLGVWVLLGVYDTGLLVLIAVPAFRAYRSSELDVRRSTLFKVVHRDGVLYYLYTAALSALNVIVILNVQGTYAPLLIASLERVVYSILTSHVVLHIREQAYRTEIVTINLPNSIDMDAELEFRRSGV
ncbi:hypothetical protein BDN72DRAFT_882159 [Pluteus cervinus]|uniref:Uncharacterized protein n=1 Tax=Pluteus cervinus TaxID=181527 RepID=A0ACD3AER7_9AGAR|nr:hypothetical protein BDN72DRAFT_882159 [Pluteus cervinus]